jgi:hypothetical protein
MKLKKYAFSLKIWYEQAAEGGGGMAEQQDYATPPHKHP